MDIHEIQPDLSQKKSGNPGGLPDEKIKSVIYFITCQR
jgi:hypothetical protein